MHFRVCQEDLAHLGQDNAQLPGPGQLQAEMAVVAYAVSMREVLYFLGGEHRVGYHYHGAVKGANLG